MQWIADPDGKPETNDFPQLVSNSWGDDAAFDTKDPQEEPFCKVVNAWVKLGMIPVFAAGNAGPEGGSVGLPAGCPQAVAVGATDSSDRIASFSSRGPAKWKTGELVKPEVSAPGVGVKSARPGGGYQSMSGTSMSTPHISGVLALILQANPALTVDGAVKSMLAGVTDLGPAGKDNSYGWGRPDLLKSVDLLKTPATR
jgi:subtilisin family serine protease